MKCGVAELITRSQQGDRDATEQMVVENNGLIWSIARRFFGRGVDPDDLYQLGCLGFLKAIEGFDLEYGTQFSTYAVPKIAGEIRRFLRDDGTIKVSRGLKEQATAVKMTRQRLTTELNREPTLSEISFETGLSVEEIAAAETATAATESIHRQSGDGGFTLESVLTTGDAEEQLIESISLRQAIDKLQKRDKMVIDLRFFRGLTQEKTAGILGVSQVQVSRIEKKALSELKKYI